MSAVVTAGNIGNIQVMQGRAANVTIALQIVSATYTVDAKDIVLRIEKEKNPATNFYAVNEQNTDVTVDAGNNKVTFALTPETINQGPSAPTTPGLGNIAAGEYFYAFEFADKNNPTQISLRVQGIWTVLEAEGQVLPPDFVSQTINVSESTTINVIMGSDQIAHAVVNHTDVDESGGKQDGKVLTLESNVYKPKSLTMSSLTDVDESGGKEDGKVIVLEGGIYKVQAVPEQKIGILGGAAVQGLSITKDLPPVDVTDYTEGGTNSDIAVNQTTGIITVPSHSWYSFIFHMVLEETAAQKDFNIKMAVRVGSFADWVVLDSVWIESNKAEEIALSASFTRDLPADDTVKLGLSSTDKNITVNIDAITFEVEREFDV